MSYCKNRTQFKALLLTFLKHRLDTARTKTLFFRQSGRDSKPNNYLQVWWAYSLTKVMAAQVLNLTPVFSNWNDRVLET